MVTIRSNIALLKWVKDPFLFSQELELVEADAEVYKMIGPALVKQDKSEALVNVNKRIDFINTEL